MRESTKLSATAQIDDDLRQAICDGDEGFMRPGAMPSITAASSAGCKQILDAVGKARLLNKMGFPENDQAIPYDVVP